VATSNGRGQTGRRQTNGSELVSIADERYYEEKKEFNRSWETFREVNYETVNVLSCRENNTGIRPKETNAIRRTV
jgi:hypothetical protein